MSNEIAVKQESSLAVSTGSLIDSDITNDMIKVPRVTLLQSNSPIVQSGVETPEGPKTFRIGTFHESLTNDNFGDTLDFIPFMVNAGAVYLKQDEGLICRSSDRVNNMHGGKCAECPYTDDAGRSCHYDNWGKDAKGNKIKPVCQKAFDVMAYLVEAKRPVLLTFKSSAISTWEAIATSLKAKKIANHDAVRIKAEKVTDGMKIYQVPKLVCTYSASAADRDDALLWRQVMKAEGYVVTGDEHN